MYKSAAKTQQADNPYADRVGLVYARVSSKKQETEGHGKEGQEGRCKADLASIKVPFEKSFLDTFTGAGDFMKRPDMRALLAHIDAHPHKKYVVVFDDLKRFARDVEFHFKLRSAFRARDVVLRCLNYNFQDSDEGWFAELVSAGSAELERRQNRRQVIQKTKARLEQGYYPFNAKKGYDFIKDPVYPTNKARFCAGRWRVLLLADCVERLMLPSTLLNMAITVISNPPSAILKGWDGF
jgi:DNA invertase Pin-like site-specific DNA recombinase